MAYQKLKDFGEAISEGIEYMLLVGRRQPMTIAHSATIRRVCESGMKPIIVIGSANTAYKDGGEPDPLFEPVSNPLSVQQQIDQLQAELSDLVLGRDYFVTEMKDLGNNAEWCAELERKLHGQINIGDQLPDISTKTALHFIGKPKDKKGFIKDGTEVLGYWWEETFDKLGIPVLQDRPLDGIDPNLSATDLRNFDLNNLSNDDRTLFANPDYIITLANQARSVIAQYISIDNIPVTLFDLTMYRLAEKGIYPDAIYAKALEITGGGEVDLLAMKQAARE